MGNKKNKTENSEAMQHKMSGVDESTIIREQERLAKAAKRKKTKKRSTIAVCIILVLLVTGIWYAGWGRHLTVGETTETVKIEATAGQIVVYAQIAEINGNEITYAVAEEVETEATEKTSEQGTEIPDMSEMPEDMELPEGMEMPEGMEFPGGMEMPEGMEFSGGMEMPEGMEFSGGMEMPEGMELPGGMEMPEGMEFPGGMEMPDRSEMQGGFGGRGQGMGNQGMSGQNEAGNTQNNLFVYDGNTYQVGKEMVTAYIPVGTSVTTKLGTVTTFSRLEAEDYVALVLEKEGDKEIIVAVYIVG